jgi:hypothetical protein
MPSEPTVPDRPLTVPKGAVTVTVPTVPSPPIGGTVGAGTVDTAADHCPPAHRPQPQNTPNPLGTPPARAYAREGYGPVPSERSRS